MEVIKARDLKRVSFHILIMIILVLMGGCSLKKDETKEPEGITITDMEGRTVTFDKVPEKLVVLLASDVEILYELEVQDKIVAVGEYCNYPAEALKKEVISTGEELNIEEVISLQPEAVVMGSMGQTKEQVKQLEDAGVKVLVSRSQDIANTYTAIDMLGKLSGKNKEAAGLIKEMKDAFASIKEKATGKKDKTVYFEISPLEQGLWTAGKGTFMQELADIVGVTNAFEDIDGWAEISEEQVLDRNPDYIVSSAMYEGQGKTPAEKILDRADWADVNAVKSKKVFQGDNEMMTRPGPRLVDAAKALYEFVYEE